MEKSLKVFESRGFKGNGAQVAEEIKEAAARLHSLLEQNKLGANAEAARCFAKAQTDLEQSVMWGVKGISRL